MDNKTIEINSEFKRAFTWLEDTKKNVFITGKAGTGKSTFLEHFCESSVKEAVVLAPTGVAALNVRGQTIHSFFNFGTDVTVEKIKRKRVRVQDPDIFKQLELIIIDEASMLRADLLDCIHAFLTMYGPVPGELFGGVQIAFIGDLYQLPPVVSGNEKEIFATQYQSPYFFSARCLLGYKLETVEFQKVYRQKDSEFVELLNRVRHQAATAEDIDTLNERYQPDHQPGIVTGEICLCSTNKLADAINQELLDSLDANMHHELADISGEFGSEYFPTMRTLQYKVGAQVMMLNNDAKKRWVNGSIGVIAGMEIDNDGESYLEIKLTTRARAVRVYRYTWEIYKFVSQEGAIGSELVGSFEQYPFRLAWAVTIHKSQGKTFDRVLIDIDRAFASGQTYVALSRCTSFAGIVLRRKLRLGHIRADWRIHKFITDAHYDEAEKNMSLEKKIELISQAIEKGWSLQIVYLKTNNTRTEREVDPQMVGEIQYADRQFIGMQAFCKTRGEVRNFHLSRIINLHICK